MGVQTEQIDIACGHVATPRTCELSNRLFNPPAFALALYSGLQRKKLSLQLEASPLQRDLAVSHPGLKHQPLDPKPQSRKLSLSMPTL